MTDKNNLKIPALFLVILLAVSSCTNRGHSYNVELFKSGEGWGYDIRVNGREYIHQPYMPAIEGQIPFRDKQAARKTGKLVIKKLKKGQVPSVTKGELENLINPPFDFPPRGKKIEPSDTLSP